MLPHHSSLLKALIAAVILELLIVPGGIPQVPFASQRLPGVSPQMETPEFWIKKIENPAHLLLSSEKIRKMNEENLERSELHLCRISDLKKDWTREEILSFLREDWENFGRTEEVRYGKNGMPLGESFWNKIKNNLNQEGIKEKSEVFYALIIRRTDVRVFPTDEPCTMTPNDYEFDRFQHSSLSPGSPIGIYHVSRDKEWAYAQTPFVRGWIKRDYMAVGKERTEVADYESAEGRLVVTGNEITVFGDPSLRQLAFQSQMGDSFPLLHVLGKNQNSNAFYVIQIPGRKDEGELIFQKGYIRTGEDVHQGFLPLTQENIARQAFKMLNHPYGWGDRLGGRDCSRFILDLFRTFGIRMPRNSKEQAMVGSSLGSVAGKSHHQKRKVLNQAIPLVTTLRLPGHIMLYLGENREKHYAIHSIWGIQKLGGDGPRVEKIARAVVSDLNLGEKGPNGSLLDRITDIRTIGSGG